MIAFRENLPVVRFDDCRVMPFEKAWLAVSLGAAAEATGYKKWWLASHVTESVANFIEWDFDEGTIEAAVLERAVRSVLQAIGYSDIAENFRVSPPPARISLIDLARAAGHGYELVFFDLLRTRMREAMDGNVERLEIIDAHQGIKMLRSAKSWRRDCSGLLEEVVGFVRDELSTRNPDRAVSLQMS